LGNSAAATKAVATGDPRYLQQVQLDDDVKRLDALKRAQGDAKGRNAAERRACAREITATTEQLGRLDEALPRIVASAKAEFGMTIGGRAYRERGPASSAVVERVRQAYSEGKRWGAQKAFPVASLRGVEVLASRLLTSDEVVLSVNVPCRTRAVAAKDFTGRDANGLGLVRRIENMVAEIPAYRAEVEHRQGFARTRTEELLAVADVPFEHEVALRDKTHELHTLTAQLHLDANSPQAHARAEAARERLVAQGRTPGWSLALNPTPAMLAEYGQEELMLRAGQRSGVGAELGSSAGADASVPAAAATAAAERGDGSARAVPELTAEERAVQEVMAGRRTKTIRQIVDYAANGGGATARGSGAPQRDRHRDGPARGR